FRASCGLYSTFADGAGGYSWIAPSGARIPGFDRVVNAFVMRSLAAEGAPHDTVDAYLLDEIEQGDRDRGSPEYPDATCFAHAAARAWAHLPVAGRTRSAAALIPWLLERQGHGGAFGGPLTTALAICALVDLGYAGDAIDRAAAALVESASPAG